MQGGSAATCSSRHISPAASPLHLHLHLHSTPPHCTALYSKFSPAHTASCVSPALPHAFHMDHTLYITLHWTEVHCQIRPLSLTVLQCFKPSLPAVHCTPPTCSVLTSPIFASQAFSMHSCQLMVQLWNLLLLTFSCTHFNTSRYWS